jgi:hypothetical protein
MSGGIAVKEFKHIPGVNDAEYIKKLEELREIDKGIIGTAVAKIKRLSAQLKEQPEIIRCKDCKHWNLQVGNIKGDGLGSCDFHNVNLVTGEGFCYWADRRGEEDEM